MSKIEKFVPTEEQLRHGAEHILYEYKMLQYSYEELKKALPKGKDSPVAVDTASTSHIVNWSTNLDTESPEKQNDLYKKAMLECFLLHVRNLRDFFWEQRSSYHDKLRDIHKENDGILVTDYLPEWNTDKNKYPKYPENLQKTKARLNKRLFHLTYFRGQYSKQDDEGWQYKEMFNWLKNAWVGFQSNLPNDKKSWFQSS